MDNKLYNVLFLCTGNSARSIMAEALLNALGKGRFRAFSAGSHPTGQVNPLALEVLKEVRLPVEGLRSKSWEEFARPAAPPLDFVFTVCDKAAGEVCPIWPGQPMPAHWGIEDPAAFEGSEEERRRYFSRIFIYLRNRILIFTGLPFDKLDTLSLQKRLMRSAGYASSGDERGLGSDKTGPTFLLNRHRVMSLPLDPHIKFVEGWLRLFLGMVQIIFATAEREKGVRPL